MEHILHKWKFPTEDSGIFLEVGNNRYLFSPDVVSLQIPILVHTAKSHHLLTNPARLVSPSKKCYLFGKVVEYYCQHQATCNGTSGIGHNHPLICYTTGFVHGHALFHCCLIRRR